jgi:secreted PhoX family phosphatase
MMTPRTAAVASAARAHAGQTPAGRSRGTTGAAATPRRPTRHHRKDTPDWETTLGLSLDLAFDGPDNVHISPYGSLVIAEDGNTAQHLLSWTKETGAQAIARNLIVLEQSALGGNVYSEMTGPNFSPNGSVLFANVQEPGHTFAITGPWKKYLQPSQRLEACTPRLGSG